MKTTLLRYHVVIRREGKHYIADVPTLGISDFGTTVDLAKKHVTNAIVCHIEGLQKTGSPVPLPDTTTDFYLATTEVAIPGRIAFA